MTEIDLKTVHLAALAFAGIAVALADREGFAYFRGTKPILDPARIERSHYLVWAGLLAMIASGALMVLRAPGFYFSDPAFIVKMAFVGLLVGNGFAIGSLSRVASEKPFRELSSRERMVLFASGIASATGWIGAGLTAFLFL